MPVLLFIIVSLLHIFDLTLGTEFVIGPVDRKDQQACAKTGEMLEKTYPGKVRTYSSEIQKVTQFWLIEADPSEVDKIKTISGVLYVEENRPITMNTAYFDHAKGSADNLNNTAAPDVNHPRAINNKVFLHQKDASPDLALVSWPRTNDPIPWGGSTDGYWYNILNGIDTFIYVIEEGIEPNHPDFRTEPWKPQIEWLWTPGVSQTKVDDDPIYHGSCVASKAAGLLHGVSKNSRLVIVKASHLLADNEWAFAVAYDDILQKGRLHKSVVLYARSSQVQYVHPSDLPPYWAGVKDLLSDMIKDDIFIVTSAGNEGKDSVYAENVPAIWGNTMMPLIVVGAVSVIGEIASISQRLDNEKMTVWAPGEKVKCATGIAGEQTVTGTSASAGMVAGVAAYLLRDFEAHVGPPTTAGMLQFITKLSRPIRSRNHIPYSKTPNVIYNMAIPGNQEPGILTNSTIDSTS